MPAVLCHLACKNRETLIEQSSILIKQSVNHVLLYQLTWSSYMPLNDIKKPSSILQNKNAAEFRHEPRDKTYNLANHLEYNLLLAS